MNTVFKFKHIPSVVLITMYTFAHHFSRSVDKHVQMKAKHHSFKILFQTCVGEPEFNKTLRLL